MTDRMDIFIGGSFQQPHSTDVIDVISPHSEELVGRVPHCDADDIDAAVVAARSAMLGEWGRSTPVERARVMRRFADEYENLAGSVAHAQTLEMGCPISQVDPVMVRPAIGVLRYYAELAEDFESVEHRRGPIRNSIVRRKPVGVVGAIVPWNGPPYLSVLKIGPALAAGCAVVLKPAPEAPLDSYFLAEAAIASGLPAGVLNIVPAGRDVGEYLVRHPGIDKISFTGSGVAGRRIAELCGSRLRPVTLELGGKSAAIVLEDADIETTMTGLALNCFINNGQVCAADSRVLIPQSRAEEFTEAFVAMVGRLQVGDPFEPKTDVGPLVAERQRERVEAYIHSGIEEGARVAVGGGRPWGQPTGWYVEPTVFIDVKPTMRIAQEEILGRWWR